MTAYAAADESPASVERPLVSCVMTTWNGERYIRQAIDSALAQDYAPLEVVVVDDGSTDATAAICRNYGERIRYIRQPKDDKRGATAVVRAYAEARGVYLAPLDHDDIWLPGKISRQVTALQAAPDAGAIFTRVCLIDENGISLGAAPLHPIEGDVFHQLLELNRYFYCSAMFTRSILTDVGHHDVDAGVGDWDLWLRMARVSRFIAIQEVYAEYRIHGNNYSNDPARMVDSLTRVINNQQSRWHSAHCTQCIRSSRKGLNNVKGAYLQHFHKLSRNNAPLAKTFMAFKTVMRQMPRTALQPRHAAAIAKSIGMALYGAYSHQRRSV